MKQFPRGYLDGEAWFCRKEMDIWSKLKSDEEQQEYGKIVLNKREEFRKLWNLTHRKQVEE